MEKMIRFCAEYKNQRFAKLYLSGEVKNAEDYADILKTLKEEYLPDIKFTDITFSIRPE